MQIISGFAVNITSLLLISLLITIPENTALQKYESPMFDPCVFFDSKRIFLDFSLTAAHIAFLCQVPYSHVSSVVDIFNGCPVCFLLSFNLYCYLLYILS